MKPHIVQVDESYGMYGLILLIVSVLWLLSINNNNVFCLRRSTVSRQAIDVRVIKDTSCSFLHGLLPEEKCALLLRKRSESANGQTLGPIVFQKQTPGAKHLQWSHLAHKQE